MTSYRSQHKRILQNWPHRIRRYWPEFLSIAASLATLVGLGIALLSIKERSIVETIYVVELSCFATFLFFYLIWVEYRYSRKAKYAEALYGLHNCIHFLRDYHFDFPSLPTEAECRSALEDVATSLANAFSLITGTHCRACIKRLEIRGITAEEFQKIENPTKRVPFLYVNTFCRDAATAGSKDIDEDKFVHLISGNTDFLELYLKPKMRVFFSNDLSGLGSSYNNSSIQAREDLSYTSTMVWPIRRSVYKDDRGGTTPLNQEQDIIGFLCVDSGSRGVFRRNYDFEAGALVADALFIFLKCYWEYLHRQENTANVNKFPREDGR